MLTNKQHEIRKNGLGGSDIAAICGISSYKTPLDVFLEKTTDHKDNVNNNAVHFGNLLEPVIADEYARRTNYKVFEEEKTLQHPKYEFMIANIDRWVGDKEFVLECKTSSEYLKHLWGEQNTDQIPDYYLTQVAWYACICDVEKVDIAVLIGGQDFRIYSYLRNKELENNLINIAYKFWNENVLKNKQPEPQNANDLKSLYKKDNQQEIIAPPDIIEKIQLIKDLKTKEKQISEEIKLLQFTIQHFMKDNSHLVDDQGNVIATWKQTKPRNKFNAKQFKQENENLYKNYLITENNNRVFLIK